MQKKYSVVCMKWGKKYGPDYVNRLYRMAKRNLTVPFEFICFTDDSNGFDEGIQVRPLPEIKLPYETERGWRKIALFDKNSGLDGRVLFLDLDTVIVSNIDEYFTLDGDFIFIKHWKPSKKQGIGETGVYRFDTDKLCDVYDYYVSHMDEIAAKYRHEQAYVGGKLGDEGRLKFWPTEWMPSFKYNCMRAFPLCFFLEPKLPEGAKMVIFHGNPTPSMALEGKITGFKKLFRHVVSPKWLADNWK